MHFHWKHTRSIMEAKQRNIVKYHETLSKRFQGLSSDFKCLGLLGLLGDSDFNDRKLVAGLEIDLTPRNH